MSFAHENVVLYRVKTLHLRHCVTGRLHQCINSKQYNSVYGFEYNTDYFVVFIQLLLFLASFLKFTVNQFFFITFHAQMQHKVGLLCIVMKYMAFITQSTM